MQKLNMDKPILINRDLQSSSLVNRSTKRKLVSSVSSNSASSFKLTEMIKNQSNENDRKIDWEMVEKFRLKVKKFMSQSSFGLFYENILLVLSILSCFEYIYSTYLKGYLNNDSPINKTLSIIELSLATVFAVDWWLCFFTADHKVIFCSSFFSMVDLLTVVPIYITYGRSMPNVMFIHTFKDAFIYSMFAMGTTRILRALRVRRKLAKIEDAVERFLAEMCMSIAVMILFFAACIQFVEYPYQIHHYSTWVYMMWVTMSTVGYGDVIPYTTQGRVVIMCIISFSIIIIPKMTNELIEKMKLQTIYARAVYTPLSKKSKHVVICGDISSTSMSEFFDELFHEDHENPDLHAILLLPHPPSIEMILLITNSKFFLSFLYLEGSALIDNDLKRAKIESSEAIFIMSNKFSLKPDEEDAKTILLSLSIKRYISSFNKNISTGSKLYCMQIIRPQNLRHLNGTEDIYNQSVEEHEQFQAGGGASRGDSVMDLVVCMNEIKMGVLAKGVMYPGANTLLMNLVSSFSQEVDDEEEEEEEQQQPSDHQSKTIADNQYIRNKPWLKEYQKGCDWEIYSTELSPIFEGTKFSELSYALYEKTGVVLFAIQITDKSIKNSTRLLLNPAAFVIPSQQLYEIEAFVIAQNQASSNLSFSSDGQNKKLANIEDLTKVVSSMSHTVNNIGGTTAHALSGMISSNNLHIDLNANNKNRNTFAKKESRLSVGKARVSAYRIIPTERDSKEKSFHSSSNNNNNSGSESEKNINQTIKTKPSTKPSRAKELWKKLKRSSLLKQTVETFSYQEILNKLEDQHWIDNYYLREKIVTQKSVTIKTNVTDEIPHINHHLIVIGKGLNNLLDLIQPLRSKHLGILKYIVILSVEELPIDMWQRICMFDAIVLVKGSALEEKNLRRAGIFRASQVVVLADGNSEKNLTNSSSSSGGMSALVDSDAIFTYQCVKRMNPNTQIIVEIVNSSNISYLDAGDLDNNYSEENYKLSSQFAAGNLFTTTLLDSVVCQAYYNPSIIKVMKKLLSGVDQAESGELEIKAHYQCLEIEEEEANYKLSKQGKAGGSSGSDAGGSDDSNSEKDIPTKLENISQILRNSIHAVNNDEKIAISNSIKNETISKLKESTLIKIIKGSCLYQMEMTEALGSKTYGEIYFALSLQGIIPLGLLRGTLADMALGPKQNRYPYVFTNPDKDTEVYKCDKIFVLSTRPIQALGKVDIKDWLLNIQMQKNKNEAIGSSIQSTTTIAKDKRLEHIDLLQKKIDARINKVSHNMKKQLNNLSKVIENCISLSQLDNNNNNNSGTFNLARRGSIESSTSGGSDTQRQLAAITVSPSNNNVIVGNQHRRSSLESAISNTSALTNNVTVPSEQELQKLKIENNNNNNNNNSTINKKDDANLVLKTELHTTEKTNSITNSQEKLMKTTSLLPSENKIINDISESSDYPLQQQQQKKKMKSTPLKHLLNELDTKFKGPSIKLVMSPITKKRIQKIRAVSANYNKTNNSNTYRVLSASKNREDYYHQQHHNPPRSSSYISTEAIYYKQDAYSDEGSLSDNISDNDDLYEEV